MKIAYVDNKANSSYLYYGDLYRSLCRAADVSLIKSNAFRVKHLSASKPDVVIFGLGWMSQKDPNVFVKIEGLRKLKIPIICLLHKPQAALKHKLRFCRLNADLLIYSQKEHKEYGETAGVASMRSWMGGDQNIYKDRGLEKIYDFGFSGALHGGDKIKGKTNNLRTRVHDAIKSKPGLKLFWNGSDSIMPRIQSVKEYACKINQSKIWLTTTGPLEDVSPRYFEIGLSKTLILCNKMDDAYGDVFRDGENCVMFKNDLRDFDEKLAHYLNSDKDRQKIIDYAYDEFRKIHTWDNRAAELIERIKKIDL